MKKIIKTVNTHNEPIEKEITVIPVRYIFAIFLVVFETASVIAAITLITIYLPFFFIAVIITQIVVAIAIINRKDNPDYKLPWLFFVMFVPIIGFMLYFMFYSRKLDRKQAARLMNLTKRRVSKDDEQELTALKSENPIAYSQAVLLKALSDANLYTNTDIKYYSLGESLFAVMIDDLKKAEKFIFMEYFIIESGLFWNTIFEILKAKAASGVEVRVIYDDIGCMATLPGNHYKQLRKLGIKAVPFSLLRGQANNEFNNRSHRKITVIDGTIGYTGGVNIADEYINKVQKYGHWKDIGIRLCGEAVNELIRLFLIDYNLNIKKHDDNFDNYYGHEICEQGGYCVPFGDGPKPVYNRQVSKTAILDMLWSAKRYVYITTPYLILDSELIETLEIAAMRGIDIRIITPHIPDKKLVFGMTRCHYPRLLNAGVKIYEYESGFIHAKTYLCDDETAIIGTINLDYRSLVHHFENGVWIYKHSVLADIKDDFLSTQSKSIEIEKSTVKNNLFRRFLYAIVKIISPLL